MHIHQHGNCQFNFSRLMTLSIITTLLIVFASTSDAYAQRRKSALEGNKTQNKNNTTQPGQSNPNPGSATRATNPLASQPKQPIKKEKDEEFAPQVVTMEVNREGIQLFATWFPPIIEKDKKKKNKALKANGSATKDKVPEAGKSVVPFILVHDWTRNRSDMLQLASFLQARGHAVIVPDLRGHGQSLTVNGRTKPIDHTKFKKAEKASAVGDIDQCKRFLQERNNEGILNIDLLNVVAVGDSAHLAIAWAITDWSWEPVAGIKQGKDVKSLILFSPSNKFAGSSLRKLVKEPLISGRKSTPLPMLVVWGGRSDAAEGCSAFVNLLRKTRPEAPAGSSSAVIWQTQNLFDLEAPTQMTGIQLAGSPNAEEIWLFANNFVSQKVVEFSDQFPWQIRGADAVLKAREALEK